MSDDREALSRRTDPATSRAVRTFRLKPALRKEILAWVNRGGIRGCGKHCTYAADFEITNAMKHFPSNYEGATRRQTRSLRDQKFLVKVPLHQHWNTETKKNQQCFQVSSPQWGKFRRSLNGNRPR